VDLGEHNFSLEDNEGKVNRLPWRLAAERPNGLELRDTCTPWHCSGAARQSKCAAHRTPSRCPSGRCGAGEQPCGPAAGPAEFAFGLAASPLLARSVEDPVPAVWAGVLVSFQGCSESLCENPEFANRVPTSTPLLASLNAILGAGAPQARVFAQFGEWLGAGKAPSLKCLSPTDPC
jgi:hypothetical protein